MDADHPSADDIAELLSHADEPGYPLWKMAGKRGVIGQGELAKALRKALGQYPKEPEPTGWTDEINYQPTISLDEKTWRLIHGQLGWANDCHDPKIAGLNFWLWSESANQVRFVVRKDEGIRDGAE